MTLLGRAAFAAAVGALSACTTALPPAPPLSAQAPPQWQAPLPHEGKLSDLSQWWQQHGDALLAQLVAAAQQVSPDLATAGARIAQARAERIASGAALLPALDASASIGRMSQQSTLPLGTTSQAALQASWEIDLFGANRAARDAAQARFDSARAGWHEARVSVAAEVASQYYSLRACQQQQAVAEQDAASRAASAGLTELAARAGFQAPATAALARASAADGNSRAVAQRAACDGGVKALVALTAVPEAQLRRQLRDQPAVAAPAIAIAALPAATLAQRPDVFRAEQEVTAASADVGQAAAQRYPRLSLSGSVGLANFRSNGDNTKLDTWSIGPLAISLPVFDAGRRRANVDAAAARYEAAVSGYHASVRRAVAEVEQALVTLDASASRAADADTALEGYRISFTAYEQRYQNGMASLLELEEARRNRLAAEDGVINLRRERSAAWVALYRAAGGGWQAAADNANNAANPQ